MKKLVALFLLVAAALTAHAQNLTQAEKLYNDGDFASALPKYQEIIKTSTGDTLYQAQLRAAACQYSQGEYLNAAKTIFGYALPDEPLWKARFLLYRVQMAQQTANQYNRILQGREIENNDDMEQWTRAQWHSQMQKDYETLWGLRTHLIKAPVASETLILNLKNTDTRRIPTLFDFAAKQWAGFLGRTEQALPAGEARSYLDGASAPVTQHKDRANKLAYVLQTAYTLEGTGRQNARLFWQTDYILLPFARSDFFEITDEEKALKSAVEKLNEINGTQAASGWWQKLKKRVSNAATDYGKSYAAYQTAQLLYQHDQRSQALAVCQEAQKQLASSYYTQQCQELQRQIVQPELSVDPLSEPIVPQQPVLSVTARNVPTVYARIYPVTQNELKTGHNQNSNSKTLDYLTRLNDDQIKTLLSSSKQYQTAQADVTYPKPYFPNQAQLALPALPKGFYAVLTSYHNSFNFKNAPVNGLLINSTDLALFVTSAIADDPDLYVHTLAGKSRNVTPKVLHFFTINLKTGQVEPYTPIKVSFPWENKATVHLATDAYGVAGLTHSFNTADRSVNFSANALAQKDGFAAFVSNIYFHFDYNAPAKLFIQTDRAIYSPGQKVQISVQGFERTVRGWQVFPDKEVKITVRGANGKQVFQQIATLNGFGTAQTEFTLPEKDLLLGNFSINVSNAFSSAYHSFQVEEYKRPEYEITLNDPSAPLAYGKKGSVKGQATYYAGTPLQNATVKYTVTRRQYIPLFYWWIIPPSVAPQQIAQGETKTNDKGEFSVSFTPEKQQKNESASQYIVKAEVYDETGRAIETTRTYRVSQYPRLFKIDFTQGFYDAGTAADLAAITLTDADGNAITGSVKVRVARVKDTPAQEDIKSLDLYYKNAPEENTLFTQQIDFTTAGAQTLRLPAAPEGIYRLILQADDAEEQAVIFVVAGKQAHLNLPAVALPQHTTYYPGETARILLGAGKLSGAKRVEVYQQENFLRTAQTLPGELTIYEIPVTAKDRGGLAVAWFGAGNYTFYHDSVELTVPYDNQQLAVNLQVPPTVKPGQTVSWKLTATDAQNTPVNGQASLTVYDKSLDYYAKKENPFTLTDLFPQMARVAPLGSSKTYLYDNTLFEGEPELHWQEPPQLPSLNLVMQQTFYNSFGGARKGMATRAVAGAAAPAMAMKESLNTVKLLDLAEGSVEQSVSYGALDDAREMEEVAEERTTDNIRTDFAETAYFNSQIPFTKGSALVRFTLPQSITTWNILGFALTKDAKFGSFTAGTVARKDFMVRLHLPRFYREQDKGILQVSVVNTTKRKITVPVTLSVKQDTANKATAFGIKNSTHSVTVPAESTVYTQWEVTVPTVPGLYQITAVGRTATDSDGEQKDLPVFPSRTRLLASAHTALHNGSNTLKITELDDIADAQPEVAALTLHPSLALSVLNKMPNLLTNPYNDLISSLNRYVPLAIVHQFYTTYPQLKEAVKKLPARTGTTAPWDETNPLRLAVLEQTPWLRLSQGGHAQQAAIVNLFDETAVTKQLDKELPRILKFQNASGSFSWFAGGPEDTYLTLRALDAFSQAVRFGVKVPEKEIQKALAYIVPKINKELKDDKTGSVHNVSYALYAAYTLSAFPAQWEQVSKAKTHFKKWVDYADEQSKFMTPLGQAYAASVYHRLGDDLKANQYLDKLLARMKYNELTGAYFAPEAQSWVWYQDTLTTQTATLKTLLEVRPQSDKIDPMIQWLLFNKQVTDWKNPAAAAQAVFALLDVMHTKGALSEASTYQVRWADIQTKRTFEPLDWTTDLQWVKQGSQITSAAYSADVTKQSKVTDFASLNVIYTSAQAKASPKGVLNVTRRYFVRVAQEGKQILRPIQDGDEIHVGDEVEVQLTLEADSAFDYVLVADPKPAGFENADLHSGWTWNPVSMYREVRDADTNYFIQRLPAGTVRLSYVLRPTVPGKFHVQPAQVQSMYAPEYGAHSATEGLAVRR